MSSAESDKTFKQLFKETAELVKNQNSTYEVHLAKLMEESGEFAQEINKLIGTKERTTTDTETQLTLNILEEAADQIQIIIGIISKRGCTSGELLCALQKKNEKYKKKYKL